MKNMQLRQYLWLWSLLSAWPTYKVCGFEIFKECESADKFRTFVASRTDCMSYYFCNGEDSYKGICLDGNGFNDVLGRCVDIKTLNCSTKISAADLVYDDEDVIDTITTTTTLIITTTTPSRVVASSPETTTVTTMAIINVDDDASDKSKSALPTIPQQLNLTTGMSVSKEHLYHPTPPTATPQIISATTTIATPPKERITPPTLSTPSTPLTSPTAPTALSTPTEVEANIIVSVGTAMRATPESLCMALLLNIRSNANANSNSDTAEDSVGYTAANAISAVTATDFHYLPNAMSCTAYYACYKGVAISLLCDAGTYFNPNTSRCESILNVNCMVSSERLQSTPAAAAPTSMTMQYKCTTGLYDYIPDLERCDYYHYCFNGISLIYHCPDGYTWHYIQRTCVSQAESHCFTTEH